MSFVVTKTFVLARPKHLDKILSEFVPREIVDNVESGNSIFLVQIIQLKCSCVDRMESSLPQYTVSRNVPRIPPRILDRRRIVVVVHGVPVLVNCFVLPLERTMISSPDRLVARNYRERKKLVVDKDRIVEDDAIGASILDRYVQVDGVPVVTYLRCILLAFNDL